MYNWITLLYTWNEHNTVNQLYSNKIKIFFKNQSSSLMRLICYKVAINLVVLH